MKPVYGFLLLVFLLSFKIAFGQEENNSVLGKKITIEAKNESIASFLTKISTQAQVFFSYDASLIEAEKKIDVSITDKTIQETLDVLFDSKFEYKVLGEQIIITKPEDITKNGVVPNQGKPKVLTFRGRVVDVDEKNILPYSSISILRSNIGTVSNLDGEFVLKIPDSMRQDTIVVSCLGYRKYWKPISEILDEKYTIYLQPTSVQLKEIKVTAINPQEILHKIISKIVLNYSHEQEIMTSFYREVLKQDNEYIDVAEALMEIRKSPYQNSFSEDKVKFIKGRKSINVKPFKYVDFKIQGGPYYITKLDVVKTLDSFLDAEFFDYYKYSLDEIVEFDDRETYVIRFKPIEKDDNAIYQGKLYVDMSTFALVQAEFSLSRSGLKYARAALIKKKSKDLSVRPLNAEYNVSYRRANNKWHLSNAQASINFKVKSKNDKINSTFHSISELLITDIKPDYKTHFKKNELFSPVDIFTDVITDYDENFWGDYNIIKPTEDLRDALRDHYLKNDSLFNINEMEEKDINKK